MPRHKVAVYGTLRRGEANHYLLENSTYLGDDEVRGKLLKIGWFPGLIPVGANEASDYVTVELYGIDDATLKALDHLEGYRENDLSSSLYLRYSVITLDGEVVWVYLWNGDDNYPAVPSGDWVKSRKGEKH